MKAITVRQPWAWAIMHAGKDVENRSRNIVGSYRGPLVIHAGLAPFEKHNAASIAHRQAHGSEVPTDLHFGAALGVVTLTDSHTDHRCRWVGASGNKVLCSTWAEAACGASRVRHLVLTNPRPFAEPIPYRGALGLWEFPDELLPEVAS